MEKIYEFEQKLDAIECALQKAARIEKLLRETQILCDSKAAWPDYQYDADDKKDQEPETIRVIPTAKDIDFYEVVKNWLGLLSKQLSHRTITGKKIIWARARGFSYYKIAVKAGMPPKTCENWYKQDLRRLADKVEL